MPIYITKQQTTQFANSTTSRGDWKPPLPIMNRIQPPPATLDRRQLLRHASMGFGGVALAGLLQGQGQKGRYHERNFQRHCPLFPHVHCTSRIFGWRCRMGHLSHFSTCSLPSLSKASFAAQKRSWLGVAGSLQNAQPLIPNN